MRKLRCISNKMWSVDYTSSWVEDKITIGKIYETDWDEPNHYGNIEIINDNGNKDYLRVYCFEEVKEGISKPKLIVRCIDNKGSERSLTIGKEYEVIKEYSKLYKIKDERGEKLGWCKLRFEVVRMEIVEEYQQEPYEIPKPLEPSKQTLACKLCGNDVNTPNGICQECKDVIKTMKQIIKGMKGE